MKLRKLQLAQIILLEKFNKICIENNIKYSLGYGTALGAVRHKGFIPWDNDIDIIMLRSEYEKFIGIFKQDQNFSLQNFITDRYFSGHFSRMLLEDTFYEPEYYMNNRFQKKIFIDIFPLDEISSYRLARVKKIIINFLWKMLEFKSKNEKYKNNHLFINILVNFFFFIIKKEKIDFWIENLCRIVSYKKYNFIGCYLGEMNIKSLKESFFKKTIMNKYTTISFENEKYLIIEEYDKYLKKIYGNYLNFPSKEYCKIKEINNIKLGKWEKEINDRLKRES